MDSCSRSSDIKTGLARFIWQSAETADALRNRVFELRFPSRLLEEEGTDRALIELFGAVRNSPSVPAFLLSIGKVLLPALRDSFRPIWKHLIPSPTGPRTAFCRSPSLKRRTDHSFERWSESALAENPELRERALAWTQAVAKRLSDCGRSRNRAVFILCHRRDLCPEQRHTSFQTSPRGTRASGLAAFTGRTWSIPLIPTAKECNCNSARLSVT